MATIEQRLKALESNHLTTDTSWDLIVIEGGITRLQKDQIAEAERKGVNLMLVKLVSANK